jgi:glycine cleavage system H lipoate-binding protein
MQGILPNKQVDRKVPIKNSIDDISELLDEPMTHQLNHYLLTFFSECKIYLDRFYHSSHLWYKVDSETIVSVGINNLIIKILQPVQNIRLPQVGTSYLKDQPIAWILRKDRTLPLYSPVEGKVVKLNRHFLRKKVNSACENDDYFFKMEGDRLWDKLQQSCGNMSGLKYFTESANLVRKFLEITFNQSSPIHLGTTLADGGQTQLCLEKVIGEMKFKKLMSHLFFERNLTK